MYKISRIIELVTLNFMLILTLIIFVLARTIFDDIYSNYDMSTSQNIITARGG